VNSPARSAVRGTPLSFLQREFAVPRIPGQRRIWNPRRSAGKAHAPAGQATSCQRFGVQFGNQLAGRRGERVGSPRLDHPGGQHFAQRRFHAQFVGETELDVKCDG
jgi:hypothetical protein